MNCKIKFGYAGYLNIVRIYTPSVNVSVSDTDQRSGLQINFRRFRYVDATDPVVCVGGGGAYSAFMSFVELHIIQLPRVANRTSNLFIPVQKRYCSSCGPDDWSR